MALILPLQAHGQGAASWCHACTRNLQNIKATKWNTLPQPHIASVEPPWLETTHFQKCMYISNIFWQL